MSIDLPPLPHQFARDERHLTHEARERILLAAVDALMERIDRLNKRLEAQPAKETVFLPDESRLEVLRRVLASLSAIVSVQHTLRNNPHSFSPEYIFEDVEKLRNTLRAYVEKQDRPLRQDGEVLPCGVYVGPPVELEPTPLPELRSRVFRSIPHPRGVG